MPGVKTLIYMDANAVGLHIKGEHTMVKLLDCLVTQALKHFFVLGTTCCNIYFLKINIFFMQNAVGGYDFEFD